MLTTFGEKPIAQQHGPGHAVRRLVMTAAHTKAGIAVAMPSMMLVSEVARLPMRNGAMIQAPPVIRQAHEEGPACLGWRKLGGQRSIPVIRGLPSAS